MKKFREICEPAMNWKQRIQFSILVVLTMLAGAGTRILLSKIGIFSLEIALYSCYIGIITAALMVIWKLNLHLKKVREGLKAVYFSFLGAGLNGILLALVSIPAGLKSDWNGAGDNDGDGVPNSADPFPNMAYPPEDDHDQDGLPNSIDPEYSETCREFPADDCDVPN